MDRVTAVEYQRAAPRGPLASWLPLALALSALVALVVGAPGALPWLATTALAAPLAGLAGLALFTLPGLAILRLLYPAPLPLAERMALALSLSCAVPPLLLLYSDPLGLRWGSGLGWSWLGLCALVAAWPRRGEPWAGPWRRLGALRPEPGAALLLALALGALAVRLYAARDLPVGMWGDSYHHTMIVQLMVERGGLFRSWAPYAELSTLTYHFGFHAIAAWLSWLGGVPPAQAVIAVGQIMGAAVVPLLYLLTVRLSGSRVAGLWAALIAGFVALMPGYYVNWGRYTQLAGQTALVGACVAWAELIERASAPGEEWRDLGRPVGLAIVALVGVFLCHYRIGAFAACFIAAYGLYALATRVRSWRALLRLAGAGLAAGLPALLLTTPWLLRMREGKLLRYAGSLVSSNVGSEGSNSFGWEQFELATRHSLLALAALGLAASVAGRRWRALVVLGWAGLLWLAANPFLVGLNGAGLISSFAVLLGAYLALAPLAGMGLAWLGELIAQLGGRLLPGWQAAGGRTQDRANPAAALVNPISSPNTGATTHAEPASGLRPLSRWPQRVAQGAQLLAGAALLAWGANMQARIVDPTFQLFTPADATAVVWLRGELPTGAKIFVNGFGAYDGSVYVGTDGGWWLPLLTQHPTNIPPITYGMEAGVTPDYYQQVLEQNRALTGQPLDAPATAAALKAAGFGYLYNSPAANPPVEYIDPAILARSPLYELIYNHAGVTIWRVR